ncbi:MAG: purine-nucleoside phosphorylase [Chitinophagaceae bacterium]|nr:purine-nucleoside phosphorylase [Chitinophagaceae bacterium]
MSLHISAQKGEIATIVLLAGDPLRAQHIAGNMLQDVKLVSSTRNAFYFTGSYKGVPVTVGASGMGCPSIGIYSYELFNEYGVECIIRIGTAGAYTETTKLYDVINTDKAYSESTYAREAFGIEDDHIPHQGIAYNIINETAEKLKMPVIASNIHSSDVFYRTKKGTPPVAAKNNCVCVEMEAFALFANAQNLGKMAATIVTISDIIPTHESMSADQRQSSLDNMTKLALESVLAIHAKIG